jgi:hypothetical protein
MRSSCFRRGWRARNTLRNYLARLTPHLVYLAETVLNAPTYRPMVLFSSLDICGRFTNRPYDTGID